MKKPEYICDLCGSKFSSNGYQLGLCKDGYAASTTVFYDLCQVCHSKIQDQLDSVNQIERSK